MEAPMATSSTPQPRGRNPAGGRGLLQFFARASPDPSGFGEGATLLGAATVTTDAACEAAFTTTLAIALPAGHVVTATSTITNEFGQLATSEFSNALRLVPQTSEEATQAPAARVRELVAQGDLHGLAGFVLTIKLRARCSSWSAICHGRRPCSCEASSGSWSCS